MTPIPKTGDLIDVQMLLNNLEGYIKVRKTDKMPWQTLKHLIDEANITADLRA